MQVLEWGIRQLKKQEALVWPNESAQNSGMSRPGGFTMMCFLNNQEAASRYSLLQGSQN